MGITCTLVQVKNSNFFASLSWYPVPKARDGQLVQLGPTSNTHQQGSLAQEYFTRLEAERYTNPTPVKGRTHSSMVPLKFWNVKVSMKALLSLVELGLEPV